MSREEEVMKSKSSLIPSLTQDPWVGKREEEAAIFIRDPSDSLVELVGES